MGFPIGDSIFCLTMLVGLFVFGGCQHLFSRVRAKDLLARLVFGNPISIFLSLPGKAPPGPWFRTFSQVSS
jgi:hypothetical protein